VVTTQLKWTAWCTTSQRTQQISQQIASGGARVVSFGISEVVCRHTQTDHGLPVAVGDLACPPGASDSVAGIICFYALTRLDSAERGTAYREVARVIRPGGCAIVALHTNDSDAETWDAKQLTFRFLDPDEETHAARLTGLDREPEVDHEHPNRRSYLILRTTSP